VPVCNKCKKFSNCLTVDVCENCGAKDWDEKTVLKPIPAKGADTPLVSRPWTRPAQSEQLDDIHTAIKAVETAVKDRPVTVSSIIGVVIVISLWSVLSDAWHSKYRYALWYGIGTEKVYLETRPHDCAFLAAPLGEKYCHYDSSVSTVRWATSQTGNAILSNDEGKTWTTFSPDPGIVVPQHSTVEAVYITWDKKED
jgi:hypothetical protein